MKGSILFHDHSIRVLFDTGASHSFVSKKLVDDLSLDVSCMVTSLRIANPIGGSATLGLLCDDVEIVLCGFSFRANLHVISYLGFDMILGMDWLVRYDARIICSERILYLRHPDSSTQLSLVLRNVDNSKVALCSLDSWDDDDISRIPIVCDFSDVFEPVSGLPPKRAIECCIDLIPGAQPVSRPPTWMSTKENEELKK